MRRCPHEHSPAVPVQSEEESTTEGNVTRAMRARREKLKKASSPLSLFPLLFLGDIPLFPASPDPESLNESVHADSKQQSLFASCPPA